MKKQILNVFVVIAMVGSINAQDLLVNQVPSIIINNFNNQFPMARDVDWEKEGSLYNVEFEVGRHKDHEVWYNEDGKMVKHKEDIDDKELPNVVMKKLKTEFGGYTVESAKRISENGKVVFTVDLDALFKPDWEVVIDNNGQILNKKVD